MKPLTKEQLGGFAPIPFYNLKVHKLTLKEIDELGFDRYNQLTGLLVISQEDLDLIEEEQKEFGFVLPTDDPYEYHKLACQDLSYFLELRLAFFTYLKRDIKIENSQIVVLNTTTDAITGEEKEDNFVFTSETFFEFQTILRQINCLEEVEEPEINAPDGPMKQKFLDARKKLRLAKARERRKKTKNDDGITIFVLELALCAMSSYTLESLQFLTIYQLNAQFALCQQHENYLIENQYRCAGAKIKPKNWIYLK